jgi:hypothetical protein
MVKFFFLTHRHIGHIGFMRKCFKISVLKSKLCVLCAYVLKRKVLNLAMLLFTRYKL